jgi:GTP 3',8-cyclase
MNEMNLRKMGQSALAPLPPKLQKKIKSLYYDFLVYPLYSLKYLLYYGRLDFFDAIALETTTYCNLRCPNCPNSKYERGILKNKKLMSPSLFKKIINELSSINYRGQILLHFYGEPLSDKRLPDFVAHIKKKLPKASVGINTNGFLFTVPLYLKLVNSGVDDFFVTQYSETMPSPVKNLLDHLKLNNLENRITYRVMGKEVALSNRGGEIKVKKCVDFMRPICAYPNTAIHVNYRGDVVLCCNDYHSSITFGNLNDQTIFSIWANPRRRKLMKEIRHNIFKLPICQRCVGLK